MPWQNQGGPWGGGSGGGGGGGQGPWGRGPSGGGPRQPDIEDMVRRTQDRLKNVLPGGGGWRGMVLILVVFVLIWLATGFYRVDAGEQGIEMVFGRWNGETTQPGLNWNFPAPIGSVETPNVEQRTQTQIGLTYVGESTTRAVEEESLMLTGDENIVDIDFAVQWQINPARAADYVFNIQEPQASVKAVAEGKGIYAEHCAGCHGEDLKGDDGPDLTEHLSYGESDAEKYRSIAEGRPGGMPPFGSQLGRDRIWKVLAYVDSVRESGRKP